MAWSGTVYVDPDDVAATLGATGSDYLDEELQNAANAISAGIDLAMGRTFGKDQTASVRLYTALDPWTLTIDDVVSITSLKTDEDDDGTFERTWAVTDYILSPPNEAEYDRPYLRIDARRSGRYRFPLTPVGVRVEAVFGWPETPPQIGEACWILVEQLNIRKRKMPMGFQITPESVAYIARTDPQLSFLFHGLRRYPLFQ